MASGVTLKYDLLTLATLVYVVIFSVDAAYLFFTAASR